MFMYQLVVSRHVVLEEIETNKYRSTMSGLKFDKRELGNLEYSLDREVLATDRRGGYMSTTIVGCNTRKYHGLMVAPID